MARHHAHSHRERLPTHRSPAPDPRSIYDREARTRAVARLQRRVARIERRRARLAAGQVEVVVKLDLHGAGEGMHGQHVGRVYVRPPSAGAPSRWVWEALARQAAEAAAGG